MTFASWRKPSSTLKRQRGPGNDKSSLAIDSVRASGGTLDCCVPQESSPGPLLAVVQRVGQIPQPALVADEPWQLHRVGASRADDCHARSLVHDGPVHRAVS